MNFIKYLFVAVAMVFGANAIAAEEVKPQLGQPVDHMHAEMTRVEKRVRNAAVKVTVPFSGGHGSGSYIKFKDLYLIITAQHVADGPLGTNYLISANNEDKMATLIFSNVQSDIAVLHMKVPFREVDPMKYNPVEGIADVGTNIIYSGFPSSHKLMSFVGRIAGFSTGEDGKNHLIVNTYGWVGCSGSVIYNTKGQQVGVLYGVDVEYYPTTQVQENMIWVAPMSILNIKKAIGILCGGFNPLYGEPKACK